MRRVAIVVTAVAILGIPLSVAISTPAEAATGLSNCTKVSGNIHSTVTFKGKKCSAKAPRGYGNLTVPGLDLLTGAPFQWTNGDYVELDAPTSSATGGGNGCPKGPQWSWHVADGQVTGTSGDAYDQAAAAGPSNYQILVCIDSSTGAVKAETGPDAQAPALEFDL
jgi:hypothetical protein